MTWHATKSNAWPVFSEQHSMQILDLHTTWHAIINASPGVPAGHWILSGTRHGMSQNWPPDRGRPARNTTSTATWHAS